MTVATADKGGRPWVSPVFFVHDERWRLYWVSSKNAAHSVNIRQRPEVAIVVFVTEPHAEAVYIEAHTEELERKAEIRRAMDLLCHKPQPDRFTVKAVDDVTGEAAWRIYEATPRSAFLRADASESGQAVTVRQAVPLP